MRNMSVNLKAALENGTFAGKETCLVQVKKNNVYIDIPHVTSVNINRSSDANSAYAEVVIINVNPNDFKDEGYFNPHRNDTVNNKPSNEWYQVLKPSAVIYIYMGYENETATVFRGEIKTVVMDYVASANKITLRCYDEGQKANDNTVYNYEETYVDGLGWCISGKEYILEYPLLATTTLRDKPYLLTANDKNPDLRLIIQDLLQRCEIEYATMGEYFNTGVYLNDLDQILKFDEVSFQDAIQTILKFVPNFRFWFDEQGIPRLRKVDYETAVTISNFTFAGNKNIKSLPLALSHDEIYAEIFVKGKNIEAHSYIGNDFTLWDGSKVSPHKVKIIDEAGIDDPVKLQALADNMLLDMLHKYTNPTFECVPVPFMELYDVIRISINGLIQEYYMVDGINLSFDAKNGMDMQIRCHHYKGLETIAEIVHET